MVQEYRGRGRGRISSSGKIDYYMFGNFPTWIPEMTGKRMRIIYMKGSDQNLWMVIKSDWYRKMQ